MDDKEFRLEVLRLTLETGSAAVITNPLEQAEKNLQWCLQPLDKPKALETKTSILAPVGRNRKMQKPLSGIVPGSKPFNCKQRET